MKSSPTDVESAVPYLHRYFGIPSSSLNTSTLPLINDFSLVKGMSLKGAQPFCSIIYKRKQYYIYYKNGKYFATTSAYNQNKPIYNLDKESEVARYWLEVGFMLRLEAVEGNVFFKTYTLYDVIFNFKRIFRL